MKRSTVVVGLYLTDEMLSARLPVSSGLFALAMVLVCGSLRRVRGPQLTHAVLVAALVFFLGGVGAYLSGTPLSLFSAASLALGLCMWLSGAGLRERDAVLIDPAAALGGVLVSMAFLMLSMLGWDAYSWISGSATARPAGLYLEPSHMALYMMPLVIIAFQRPRYRMVVYGAMAVLVAAMFSVTLLVTLLAPLVIHLLASVDHHGLNLRRHAMKIVALAGVATIAYLDMLPITVEEVPVSQYVNDRVLGLLPGDEVVAPNISSLVILQGVEMAYLSLQESAGLGVGVGNLGLSPQVIDQSDYRTLINLGTTDGLDLNMRDGALLVSKLVAEFGLLALFMPLLLVRYFKALARAYREDQLQYGYHLAFATALVCLLFARALPYFAGPACLAFMSLASLTAHGVHSPAAAAGGAASAGPATAPQPRRRLTGMRRAAR